MFGKKLSKISKVSIIVILGIAIGFLGETMPDEVKNELTNQIEGFGLSFKYFGIFALQSSLYC